MGLDMYLEARKYVSQNDWTNARNIEGELPKTTQYLTVASFFPEGSAEYADHSGAEVSLGIGYWRKDNQIHNWFVQECADGEDNCQPVRVSADKLRELRATVEHVLEEHTEAAAREHLAPAQGFFFGTYEIDEWYWKGLEHTKAILDKAIPLAEDDDCSIYYQASW